MKPTNLIIKDLITPEAKLPFLLKTFKESEKGVNEIMKINKNMLILGKKK